MKLKFNKIYFFGFLLFLLIEIGILFTDGFIRYTIGDFFVVFLLYCFLKIFIDINATKMGLIVLGIAYTVEILQLTNLLFFFGWENNFIAKIILGTSFSFGDLLAYSLGISSILWIEKYRKHFLGF